MLFQSNTFSCIFILSFPGPGLPRVGQPCAAINKIGRCHRQAHHLTGAAQGREGRRADWQHEPGRSKTDLPGSSRQSARRLPQSAPPNFIPYHACVRRPPYQSVAAAHEKESKPPAGPRLVALHSARTRLSATGTRRAKGPNLGPILFPVLP